ARAETETDRPDGWSTKGLSSHRGRRKPQGPKKEAGAAGGESDARAHGPALGGEAGSVLIRKLIRKVLPYATTGVVFAITGGESATGTRCSISQSITTYAEGSEKGLSRDCYRQVGRGTEFSSCNGRRPDAIADVRHC